MYLNDQKNTIYFPRTRRSGRTIEPVVDIHTITAGLRVSHAGGERTRAIVVEEPNGCERWITVDPGERITKDRLQKEITQSIHDLRLHGWVTDIVAACTKAEELRDIRVSAGEKETRPWTKPS
ncbi:MAG: hypothetical protein OEY97_07850 [Nitrospirota bacterium]|nr:hypothetical protein [Gammaproteobacteria bacterium]MDH5527204.1 hypothetical protein [Nitrospirota bacterium]